MVTATPRPRNVLVATESDTIETILIKFEKNHVHRLFMVDSEHKPIGVIAMQDILAEVIRSV